MLVASVWSIIYGGHHVGACIGIADTVLAAEAPGNKPQATPSQFGRVALPRFDIS
jgi:hypothetical protein